MKAMLTRTALALASMLTCLGVAQAENLNFLELEARLARLESQFAAQDGIQQAAYCCDSCCESSCCCANGCCCDPCCCGSGCCDCCCGDGCCCGNGCCDCCGGCGCCGCCDCCGGCGGQAGAYFQTDIMFLRAHVHELAFGKLAEEYEISPRFILGFENEHGLGARARYWHYGHHLDLLGAAGGVRFEWDVFDAEVTTRLQTRRTDVVLGAGLRFAGMDITLGGANHDVDLFGGTIAADIETLICCSSSSYWSVVYGGRTSLLAGDWEINGVVVDRDDNVVAHEIYGGVEYGCTVEGFDMFTQLKFEIQNWHSDYFSTGVIGANDFSVGFVGPSFTFGVGY